MSKNQRFLACQAFVLSFVLFAMPAMAQGLTSVNKFFDDVTGILKASGIAVVTIALIWCGYKMVFKGAAFSEVAQVFLGGLLIGSATTIAGFLVPAG